MTPTTPAVVPRNRIKAHVRVRAGDLVPHELNPRRHTEAQRATLAALYAEIGFARSLLAYELPDGRLKLIDGHLRQDLTPDLEVDVEVLDVSDAEARALLLSLDPLAQLADYDHTALDRLRALTSTSSDAVANLWASIDQSATATEEALAGSRARQPRSETIPEQYLILVECADEETQVALLERFQQEGLKCRALLS
jgi:ParB-like chromosome segregation protein Spo0J